MAFSGKLLHAIYGLSRGVPEKIPLNYGRSPVLNDPFERRGTAGWALPSTPSAPRPPFCAGAGSRRAQETSSLVAPFRERRTPPAQKIETIRFLEMISSRAQSVWRWRGGTRGAEKTSGAEETKSSAEVRKSGAEETSIGVPGGPGWMVSQLGVLRS